METIKHTPTPWGIDNVSLALIPAMRKIGYSKETSQANAEFIVRAVNSYNALMSACKAALEREDIADDEIGDLLRSAIAKAEGNQ